MQNCVSCLRHRILPLTTTQRRCSSVSKIRFLPHFFLRTVFSVQRYSMTSCCCRLTQMARMISINCHCCRTNFISVSVIRKTRADHWCPEKCKTARTSVKEIGVCLRSGENDCGNIRDAGKHVRSAEMCGSDMLTSRLYTVFSARLSSLTSRD